LTQVPRTAASVFRKIFAVIVLVLLAILIIAFALANRQKVAISLDPFSPDQGAAFVTRPLPLFFWLIAALILGVVIGGITSWLRHSKWRRMARRYEREVIALRGEIASLRNRPEPSIVPSQRPPAERLQLKPPMR
jgi:uncharacterized integral membrane protein